MSKDIAAALPIAAKMLAGRLDIDLRFGGSTAMTNGKIIYIPQLPLDSKRAKTLAFGYLVHENGHIRDTDFQAGARVAPLDDIENILEDIRIERCAWKRYPGSRKTLSDLVELLVVEQKMGSIPKPDRPINVLMAYMLYRLRATVLEQTVLEAPAFAAEALLRTLLPDELCDDITSVMFEVRQTQSTLDVVVLARRIYDLVTDASKPPQQPPQPQPPQESEDESSQTDESEEEQQGQSGQGNPPEDEDASNDEDSSGGSQEQDSGSSGSDSGNEEDKDEQSGDENENGQPDDIAGKSDSDNAGTEGQEDDSSPQDGESDGQPGQQSDSDDNTDSGQSASDTGEDRQDEEGNTGEQSSAGANEEGSSPSNEAGTGTEDNAAQPAPGASQSDEEPGAGATALTQEQLDAIASILSDGASDVVTDLGDVIAEELNGMEKRDDDGTYSDTVFPDPVLAVGKPDALAEMMQSTRAATTALRYRMEQLMETQRRCKRRKSSSGRRINAAATWQLQAGYTRVFERSTDGQEVDTAVMLLLDRSGSMEHQLALASQATLSLAFSLSHVDGVEVAAAAFPAPEDDSGDQYGCNVLELTRFGERVPATATRYAGMEVYGGTPLAEAMLWAQHQLLKQRATRKILMVQTDGVPNDRNAALKIIRMGERAGIEIVGLGIGIDILSLIPESRMIASIDEMPRAVFGLMESKLVLPLAA